MKSFNQKDIPADDQLIMIKILIKRMELWEILCKHSKRGWSFIINIIGYVVISSSSLLKVNLKKLFFIARILVSEMKNFHSLSNIAILCHDGGF